VSIAGGPEHGNGRGERGAVADAVELQPAPYIADFGMGQDMFMPPLRIGAGRDQADDRCPLPCALLSLAEPLAQSEAVRWIQTGKHSGGGDDCDPMGQGHSFVVATKSFQSGTDPKRLAVDSALVNSNLEEANQSNAGNRQGWFD
jgi:hypothetical protein